MNNNTCINVLKILATALVYFCHSWIVCTESFDYEVHGLYLAFITPAWAGVWIFLVVGGFLAAHGFLDVGTKVSCFDNFRTTADYFGRLCNVIAPYTFTYYLWHSFMLMYVAALLKIDNDDIHFLVTTIVGILVSSYIAFIMAKMNKGIVKSLMKS